MTASAPAPCEEGAIRATALAGNCGPNAKTWVLAGTILASAIAYVDESVVNIALPAIEKNLSASVAVIQWLINAYTLCLAALLLIGGAAADRYGRRRMFIIGVSIFAAASLVCGIAPDVTVLISARALQGVGAALLIPCSLALIGASFDEAERGKAIGTWAGFSAISAAIGPILGGWIVDGFSWRWIFLINPLLALPALWIAYRHVPESVNPRSGALDWPGALLVLVALVGVCFGLIVAPSLGWTDARVLASLAGGSIFGAAFLWQEAHSGAPMLPLYLFRSRTFSSVNLLTFLLYTALAAAFFFLPFALIQVHGYSALLTGAAFLPFTVIMSVLSRWSGGLLDRFGARLPLVVGPGLAAIGFGLLSFAVRDGAYWTFLTSLSVLGLGMAIAVAPLTTTVINAVPQDQTGVASGVNNAISSLASLLAIAIFGAASLGLYNRSLDRELAQAAAPGGVVQAVDAARGQFASAVTGGAGDAAGRIIRSSLGHSIEIMMLCAAVLAFCGAASGLLLRGRPAGRD